MTHHGQHTHGDAPEPTGRETRFGRSINPSEYRDPRGQIAMGVFWSVVIPAIAIGGAVFGVGVTTVRGMIALALAAVSMTKGVRLIYFGWRRAHWRRRHGIPLDG